MKTEPYFGYFAGSLFCNKDLCGNALLAAKIFEISEGSLLPLLPQNLEQRQLDGASIRSVDLLALARSDWAIFQFDGTELDSGTVVEHEFAKTLDIPYLILRSDFRKGGDANDLPWNLMNRTASRGQVLVIDSMALYQEGLNASKGDCSLGESGSKDLLNASLVASDYMQTEIAKTVCRKLHEVMAKKPVLTAEEFENTLRLQAKTAGEQFDQYLNGNNIQLISKRRQSIVHCDRQKQISV